jgi:hypothetical protein
MLACKKGGGVIAGFYGISPVAIDFSVVMRSSMITVIYADVFVVRSGLNEALKLGKYVE